MPIKLGEAYVPPTGEIKKIITPSSQASQGVLATDKKIKIPMSEESGGIVDTFKLLSSISDIIPGYLSEKIIATQFAIDENKLKIIGFGELTSDNLTEGSNNKYLTETNFNFFFLNKTTDDLEEGVTNKYYSDSLFNISLSSKTSDDITEGNTHLYLSPTILNDINSNAFYRHQHLNKSTLDTYNFSNTSVLDAISKKHSHLNKESVLDLIDTPFTTQLKNKYDSYSAGAIIGANSPLSIIEGVIVHSDTDGSKHVPSTSGVSSNSILTASLLWKTFQELLDSSGIVESTPTASSDKITASLYIKSHVENSQTNINHVTDAQLYSIEDTFPTHIADAYKHIPSFVSGDMGKFLTIDSSGDLGWAASTATITKSGVGTYISITGGDITVDTIDLADTNLVAGTNIVFTDNTISSTQRPISTIGLASDVTCISASWALSHESSSGVGSHIPTGGTSTQYIAGDGTIKDFSATPGGIFEIIMGAGSTGSVAERIASLDTVFPTSWSGSVGAVSTDLVITHNTGKMPVNVKIWTGNGDDKTMLIGSAAYSTIIANGATSKITISSLTTVISKIYIYIQFE
jgi:hypothetical protein